VTEPKGPEAPGAGVRVLTLTAELSEVDRARTFLREALASLGLAEEDVFRLELALTEICVNITRYAFPDGPGTIRLRFWVAEGGVCVQIRDSGRPFDPRKLPSPDLREHAAAGRESGLGVYLARTLVDEFDYRREGGENVVTLLHCITPLGCP
jgi:anti-sigma regulatory factor (Ser/Thr protein kinase)